MGDNGVRFLLLILAVFSVFFATLPDDDQRGNVDHPVYVRILPEQPRQLTFEEKMAKAGITCPSCVYVPDGQVRLRETVLLEGSVIHLPTRSYLAHLRERCNGRRLIAERECLRDLREIEIGRIEVDSLANPLYGRTKFADRHLAYVQWGAGRTIQLLEEFERVFEQTQEEHFRMASGAKV